MRSRSLVLALAMLVVVSAGFAVDADAAKMVAGQVLTCPGGDPVEDVPVRIFINGGFYQVVYTDHNGQWVCDVTFRDCLEVVTAVMGQLNQPHYKPKCNTNRREGVTCCVQVVGAVPCNHTTNWLDDLEIMCGFPGVPPCPSNQ